VCACKQGEQQREKQVKESEREKERETKNTQAGRAAVRGRSRLPIEQGA